MPEVDRTLHVLPEHENERIFRNDIVPDTLAGTRQERPVVVIVAGQTGAGKTRGVIRSADSIDTQRLADSVFVLRRDAHVVYRNHLDPQRRWIRPPATAQAVADERDRPRTAQETYQFAYGVRQAQTRIRALPAAGRVAARAELATAMNLARPLLHPDVEAERITGLAPTAAAVALPGANPAAKGPSPGTVQPLADRPRSRPRGSTHSARQPSREDPTR